MCNVYGSLAFALNEELRMQSGIDGSELSHFDCTSHVPGQTTNSERLRSNDLKEYTMRYGRIQAYDSDEQEFQNENLAI